MQQPPQRGGGHDQESVQREHDPTLGRLEPTAGKVIDELDDVVAVGEADDQHQHCCQGWPVLEPGI